MSDLDDFMADNKPTGRSKLQPYLRDILTLWQHGYSEPDILRYLSEKKLLVVTRKTLHTFILKNIQSKTPTIPDAIHQKEQEASPPNAPAGAVNMSSTQQISGGIKKFDWKNASTDGLI